MLESAELRFGAIDQEGQTHPRCGTMGATLCEVPRMCQGDGASIVDCFADMEDPRFARLCLHKPIDITVIAICAVICGADNWVEIAAFGHAKYDWLKKFLELPCG